MNIHEYSSLFMFLEFQKSRAPSNTLVHRDIKVFDLHSRQFQIARDSEVQSSLL